jgi:hypothetical protein
MGIKKELHISDKKLIVLRELRINLMTFFKISRVQWRLPFDRKKIVLISCLGSKIS